MMVHIQQQNGASADYLRCYTRLLALSALCFAAIACTDGAGGGLGAVVSNELVDPASGATCSQGSNVRITKNDFETVLNGQCGAVVVTGSNGSVNVDHAQSIRVEGTKVTVLNEKVETLEAIGSDNTYNMTEVGHATIAGDRNTLLGRNYRQVTFKGQGNSVNTDNEPQLDDQGTGNKVI
ncbi:DUF3060 domain-containing protein [Lysobacter sp. K5869]|uniref:DUF3060 domain-containing protein n=1 Tax=Lysobacter sp. K5869 TaxID=2820808 RepID=UPI001C063B10|nr:DUF3060 domain-containing protein [Lysobacter sp. K5869]QWP77532.1 DUF3060 domain-containing protein [Lysobacter sp. K5869]